MDVRAPFLDRRLGYVTRRWLLPLIGALVGLVTGEAFADPQTIAMYVFGLFGITAGFTLGLLVAVMQVQGTLAKPQDVGARPLTDFGDLGYVLLIVSGLALRLLRLRRQADARPRRPAQPRRRLGLGERRHVVRAVQPAQGRQAARGSGPEAARAPEATLADAVHPPRRAEDPADVDAVPRRNRARRRSRIARARLTRSVAV